MIFQKYLEEEDSNFLIPNFQSLIFSYLLNFIHILKYSILSFLMLPRELESTSHLRKRADYILFTSSLFKVTSSTPVAQQFFLVPMTRINFEIPFQRTQMFPMLNGCRRNTAHSGLTRWTSFFLQNYPEPLRGN